MQSRFVCPNAGLAAAASSSATSRPRPRSDGANSRFAFTSPPPNTNTDKAGPDSTSDSEAITPTLEQPATSRVLVCSPMVRRINGNAPPSAVVAKKIAPAACASPACVIATAHASTAAVRGLCETEIPVPARSMIIFPSLFFPAENFQQHRHAPDRRAHFFHRQALVDTVNATKFGRLQIEWRKTVRDYVPAAEITAIGESTDHRRHYRTLIILA